MRFKTFFSHLAAVIPALACDNCFGPRDEAAHVRNVRRMQPQSPNATNLPGRGPLAWGQLNFIHSTDTHGWLEGHLKEQNYGADWGDFKSFTVDMKRNAARLGVDLLLVDTGDLHDGNGLSDATFPDGALSNIIFENVDYDLLTIGNHELYLSSVAYETFSQFSKVYGDRYLTSNVQIINKATNVFEYIGKQYRYFTTAHGLRIMAFGFLYDFTGNTNVTKVFPASTVVKQRWFLDAINYNQAIDLFVVLGHNPVSPADSESTFSTYYNAIRSARPKVPIQFFGGHSHIRNFVVYDDMTTALESGRYCETLGWLSMSGIDSPNFKGHMKPSGVPNPTQKAVVPPNSTKTSSAGLSKSTTNVTNSNLVYFRRYLDWNRATFAYHAVGSQSGSRTTTFDTRLGVSVTKNITTTRAELNLTHVYGCAPQTYCFSCQPFGAPGNIFPLISVAIGAEVVNQLRANIPRIVIVNTGGIRFDLIQGPFTYDDSFIVSPFTDGFQYIPGVEYSLATQVVGQLNYDDAHSSSKLRRDLQTKDFNFRAITGADSCVDSVLQSMSHKTLQSRYLPMTRGLHRRQSSIITPGYVTSDDFGTTGDDTIHSSIPNYDQPAYLSGNGSLPSGAAPATVDLVFLDFFAPDVITALKELGSTVSYTLADVSYYLDPTKFTTQTYLPLYAQKYWQANINNCPIGKPIGNNSTNNTRY